MLKKLERISGEIRVSNPYWKYGFDTYRMPNGNTGEYHHVISNGSVFVLPQAADGRFVLLRQYRYLNERESIEFPGGGIDPALSPELNARRELEEEAGYHAGNLERIGEFNPYNGVTNELCQVFHAQELSKVDARPEESEEFEMLKLTAREISTLINNGEIWDGMSIAAWFMLINSKKNV